MGDDNEAARRQQEISMFSAMAAGDFSSDTFGSESIAKAAKSKEAVAAVAIEVEGEEESYDADNDSRKADDESSKRLFAQAAAADTDNSGTFSFTPSANKSTPSSNLEAAAAAFTDEDDDSDVGLRPIDTERNMQNNIPLAQAVASQRNVNGQPLHRFEDESPMHSQKVTLSRPLFFGPVLPPRVVNEARSIVAEAIAAQQASGTDHIRINSLKPEVRNLIGAFRAYGHGIPILPDEVEEAANNGEAWRGSSSVTIFTPKWSEVKAYEQPPQKEELIHGDDANISNGHSSSNNNNNNNNSNGGERRRKFTYSDSMDLETASETSETKSILERDSSAPSLTDRDLFSMWARGEDDNASQGGLSVGTSKSSGSLKSPEAKSKDGWNDSLSNSWVQPTLADDVGSADEPIPMSDSDLFSQWARGESPANSSVRLKKSSIHFGDSRRDSLESGLLNSGTFQQIPIMQPDDSDDDSVVGSELKKKVGVNEHLNAALASLQEDWQQAPGDAGNGNSMAIGSDDVVTPLNKMPLTADGARALTNLELMNGCAPLFAVDDPPLPVESDLGIHETKDEQQRNEEQRRIQAVIERFCPQNLFAPIACPNPAQTLEDNQSWNKRAGVASNGDGRSIAGPGSPIPRHVPSSSDSYRTPTRNSRGKASSPTHSVRSSRSLNSVTQHRFDTGARFGWWNMPIDDQEVLTAVDDDIMDEDALAANKKTGSKNPLQIPPVVHAAAFPLIQTNLFPSPDILRNQNKSLSNLHPATSLAQTVPFLSDRSPSFRHLQIDTRNVGFPTLGGEIEPLFCSLAIYHVKTITGVGEPNAVPVPDIQKCGRVTEVLQFDVISDPEVEKNCHGSLWPYAQNIGQVSKLSVESLPDSERLQSTRCGIFPIPSQLKIENLYAVIVVQKVISESGDFEPYLRPGKNVSSDKSSRSDKSELDMLRSRSYKASSRQGKFLMPFAFGVAPLLQVFGTNVATVACSRAVQIPLHHFSAGIGERQFIDHIMVMLYPRADHRISGVGGPAPVTNGGAAMVVMRNFGYLGLHTSINGKSSLSRDRLVDFTGEVQVRRASNDVEETLTCESSNGTYGHDHNTAAAPWHPSFVAEPAKNGGKNVANSEVATMSESAGQSNDSASELYVQELASIPLQLVASSKKAAIPESPNRLGQRGRITGSSEDSEPFYHTSFCNELLCNPRLLQNCPKGNIVIKVEMREMEWSQEFGSYLARLPRVGPCVHNGRRGAFLVQEAFTSCSSRCTDPQFLDEFKMKLPLELTPKKREETQPFYALFLSVYRISFSSRKKWARKLRPKRPGKKIDEIAGDIVGETPEDLENAKSCRLIQLCSGFIPLASQQAILDNGLHSVKMAYTAWHVRKDVCESRRFGAGTLIISEMDIYRSDDATADDRDSESVGSGHPQLDGMSVASVSDTHSMSEMSDEWRVLQLRQKSPHEQIMLQVRVVVYSSLHPQNATLSEFFHQEPDMPLPVSQYNRSMLSQLKMGRGEILSQVRLRHPKNFAKTEYESERLLLSTVDISKTSMCPASTVSDHLLRIISHLFKVMTIGTGEPDFLWANPAMSLPLRVHAFATLLQLLGTSTIHFSKWGLAQLDGSKKWSILSVSRVAALIFDEGNLFGLQAFEAKPCEDMPSPKSKQINQRAESLQAKKTRRRRHVRSNFELFNTVAQISNSGDTDDLLGNLMSSESASKQSSVWGLDGDLSSRSMTLPNPLNSHSQANKLGGEFPVNDQPTGATDSKKGATTTNLKIDSVTDFKTALHVGSSVADSDDIVREKSSAGAQTAVAMIKAFSGPQLGSRRWITAPAPNLATIREDSFDDGAPLGGLQRNAAARRQSSGPLDALDTELILRPPGITVKQMRVPKLQKTNSTSEGDGETEGEELEGHNDVIPKDISIDDDEKSVPRSYEDIESAGTAFLDVIGKSLGIRELDRKGISGEQERVGKANHRKTQSRSSIDWTIPEDVLSAAMVDNFVPEDLEKVPGHASEGLNEDMTFLSKEKGNAKLLPSFVDRLVALGRSTKASERWFPYMYEIIIMQWAAVLREQQMTRESSNGPGEHQPGSDKHASSVAEAAARSVGVGVACAPVLFEIIKQSLGWRIHNFQHPARQDKSLALVKLDPEMFSSLEQIISMVTDSCLDSRNFDSRETRQTCADVNDSMIWFLRDLFAFLEPSSVYCLVLAYFSRFVDKNGRNGTDRDSMIGSRCSWEVTRLQMDAITALVRFPDFIRINSPQMVNWGKWWIGVPAHSTGTFFDQVLDRFYHFSLPTFVPGDAGNPAQRDGEVPPMRPHWLAELLTDICLLGVEHAEQEIRQRSSALLHEMFWSHSRQYMRKGAASVVASMHITFIEKVLGRADYLSTFSKKSQIRKDIMPCVLFVLQSAPGDLLRSLWRRLFSQVTAKGLQDKYVGADVFDERGFADAKAARSGSDSRGSPDIFDMFSLLNLALSTFEYEGCDDNIERGAHDDGPLDLWHAEFLLALDHETTDVSRRKRLFSLYAHASQKADPYEENEYVSTSSRKWHAHDGNLVIISTVQQIVRELRYVLEPSEEGQLIFNPARRKARKSKNHRSQSSYASVGSVDNEPLNSIRFSYSDTVVFVRGATSVYLQALSLRQSDIVLIRSLNAAVEIIKIFGIKIFNESVGETLQHWMRLITYHCGARRAEVRVPAADFLELILRSTWDSFGSFFRIRLPLLAVQTEVMEQIVATATNRHYRDQRRLGKKIDLFSNGSAEASLAPLWRTFDRLHHQSASQNVAFRSALIRLAEKMKKLFKAYIAVHALWFLSKSRASIEENQNVGSDSDKPRNMSADTILRASRISVHRVINASAGYSKQFLGFYSTALDQNTVAHHEAIEDAFLDAAEVFSSTELPDHRVAWLRKLAEFHTSRIKYAEEATCHFHIYLTLQQASRLHGVLWSSAPFLPWTENDSDGIHIDGEGPASDPDDYPGNFNDLSDVEYGKQIDKSHSFRRIFYRVANSIGFNGGFWESGVNKNLFYGVTSASEYHTVTPWMTVREMEASMLEEAETAGDLFLKSGIVESSRYLWSLATQHYADKFNYWKLAHVYEKLAQTVVSQVPPIDSGMQQEVSVTVPLGRFYRVWFHGGAPDELIGAEFVYRTSSGVNLDQFGDELREIIRGIIPDKTPIHLALDGRPDEPQPQNYTGFSRMASGTALEPVRIKVTPLRPLVVNAQRIRGLPEWFNLYVDNTLARMTGRQIHYNIETRRRPHQPGYHDPSRRKAGQHHREHARSLSASVFSSGMSSTPGSGLNRMQSATGVDGRRFHAASVREDELVGADKFSFLQPINKDRSRGSRDWLRGSSGDFAEKSLRVTQLQVGQTFPACVARQAVIHRVVYTQSPLEAGVDSVCQWCTVLFRTAIATNGQAVLGSNVDPGIGTDAAKVVADCIHSSRVKEMGLTLLKKNTNVAEEVDDVLQSYDRLSEDEVKRLQLKFASAILVFLELLHLLIARNRDILLDVIQERKRGDGSNAHGSTTHGSVHGSANKTFKRSGSKPESVISRLTDGGNARKLARTRAKSFGASDMPPVHGEKGSSDDTMSQNNNYGISGDENQSMAGSTGTEKDRTDAAIAVQSELQRSFISLTKALYPMIVGIMGPSYTPRWLKQCCLDNYFSAYTYRQTSIAISEELCFYPEENVPVRSVGDKESQRSLRTLKSHGSVDVGNLVPLSARSIDSRHPDSPTGSLGSASVVSRGSDAARSVKSFKSARSSRRDDKLAHF